MAGYFVEDDSDEYAEGLRYMDTQGTSEPQGGIKEDEDDLPCECVQTDADEWSARWCPAHGPGSPADKRAIKREAEEIGAYYDAQRKAGDGDDCPF